MSKLTVRLDGIDRVAGRVPEGYREVGRLDNYDAYLYARPPLHRVIRLWWDYKWAPVRLGLRLGLLDLREGALYSSAKPKWPWTETEGYRRHGVRWLAAYRSPHRRVGISLGV